MKNISILIAEDHQLIRQTWSYILNTHPDFVIVGECESGEEAIELAMKLRPSIVLMDINLTGMNGIDATAQIRKFSPGTKILAVSLHTQPAYARQMIKKGAMGYITKNSSREEMFEAIRQVYEGKKYICREIKEILTEQVLNGSQNDGYHSLSQRELEVISLLQKGQSSKEIASTLSLSSKTIEVHRYNILKKLKLANTAALINYINSRQIN